MPRARLAAALIALGLGWALERFAHYGGRSSLIAFATQRAPGGLELEAARAAEWLELLSLGVFAAPLLGGAAGLLLGPRLLALAGVLLAAAACSLLSRSTSSALGVFTALWILGQGASRAGLVALSGSVLASLGANLRHAAFALLLFAVNAGSFFGPLAAGLRGRTAHPRELLEASAVVLAAAAALLLVPAILAPREARRGAPVGLARIALLGLLAVPGAVAAAVVRARSGGGELSAMTELAALPLLAALSIIADRRGLTFSAPVGVAAGALLAAVALFGLDPLHAPRVAGFAAALGGAALAVVGLSHAAVAPAPRHAALAAGLWMVLTSGAPRLFEWIAPPLEGPSLAALLAGSSAAAAVGILASRRSFIAAARAE